MPDVNPKRLPPLVRRALSWPGPAYPWFRTLLGLLVLLSRFFMPVILGEASGLIRVALLFLLFGSFVIALYTLPILFVLRDLLRLCTGVFSLVRRLVLCIVNRSHPQQQRRLEDGSGSGSGSGRGSGKTLGFLGSLRLFGLWLSYLNPFLPRFVVAVAYRLGFYLIAHLVRYALDALAALFALLVVGDVVLGVGRFFGVRDSRLEWLRVLLRGR